MAAVLETIAQHPQPLQRLMHTTHASYCMATHAQLVRSDMNVRHKGQQSLDELAALIASQGLLHNLIGYRQVVAGVATGLIEIVAGWRRAGAIGYLIMAGVLPIDYEIPVLLVPQDEAIAISLAENCGREPMHPADVFDAMLALAEGGSCAADIGVAFGVSELAVRRRLKLAKVAPRFITLYREGKLVLEQMEALALVDDHVQQEQAWDSLDAWSRDAYHLRRLLTMQRVDALRDRVALYVGMKAYRAAGGTVTSDLFSEGQHGYVDDPALLERLASAKLARVAKTLDKEGWQWVDVRVRTDRADLAEYARVRTASREPTEQEAAEQALLTQRIAANQTRYEALDEDSAEGETLVQAIGEDEAALADLSQRLRQPMVSDIALAGAVVTLDAEGKPVVHRGLIRPDDKQRMSKLPDREELAEPKRPKQEHSERLTLALTAHRTVALQAVLAERPEVALCALTAKLAAGVFGASERAGIIAVSLKHRALEKDAPDIEASRAWTVMTQMHAAWSERLPADGERMFEWLSEQKQEVVHSLLAFCVAWSMDAVAAREPQSAMFVALAKASGLDMADWWTPTKSGYFEHLPKQRILDVITQALSPAAAQPLLTAKKDVVCEAAERAMVGLRWVPQELSLACRV